MLAGPAAHTTGWDRRPSAPVEVVGLIDSYRRASDPGDDWKSLEVTLETQVVEDQQQQAGPLGPSLQQKKVEKEAKSISIHPGKTWVIWYDDAAGIWEVGAFVSDSATLQVAQVDPRTGAVLGYVERARRS